MSAGGDEAGGRSSLTRTRLARLFSTHASHCRGPLQPDPSLAQSCESRLHFIISASILHLYPIWSHCEDVQTKYWLWYMPWGCSQSVNGKSLVHTRSSTRRKTVEHKRTRSAYVS